MLHQSLRANQCWQLVLYLFAKSCGVWPWWFRRRRQCQYWQIGQDGSGWEHWHCNTSKGPDGNSATPNRSGKRMRGRGRKNRLQWKLTRLTTVISWFYGTFPAPHYPLKAFIAHSSSGQKNQIPYLKERILKWGDLQYIWDTVYAVAWKKSAEVLILQSDKGQGHGVWRELNRSFHLFIFYRIWALRWNDYLFISFILRETMQCFSCHCKMEPKQSLWVCG